MSEDKPKYYVTVELQIEVHGCCWQYTHLDMEA